MAFCTFFIQTLKRVIEKLAAKVAATEEELRRKRDQSSRAGTSDSSISALKEKVSVSVKVSGFSLLLSIFWFGACLI